MKLYFEAEKYLKDPLSLSNVFNDSKLTNSPKHIYALVSLTRRYESYIAYIIKRACLDVGKRPKGATNEVIRLLVHDFLFSSRGRIQSGKHPVKEWFLLNKARLQAEMTRLKVKHGVKLVEDFEVAQDDDESEFVSDIRWVRINKVKCTRDDITKVIPELKLQMVDDLSDVTGPGKCYIDPYIPYLFGLHKRDKLTSTKAYLEGSVIIQDRASCFPSHILNYNHVHTQVIDACAAPGNKTTHSASYMDLSKDPESCVYAFERDKERVGTLRTMCNKALNKKTHLLIQVTHADFTSTKPEEFPQVTGLVVDPSCSGSGIRGRAADAVDHTRLQKLANFQFAIMKHALQFPLATKVVYSTCSIHAEENERVTVDLLRDPAISQLGWTLASREDVIPRWERRGWPEEFRAIASTEAACERLAAGCVRSNPGEDGGIGFFAACFIKKDDGSKEEEPEEEEVPEEWTGFED